MQQMERLIAQSEAVLREDIELLQRLMKEFEAELASLGARVDNLEGRVGFLEDHQFSTTTKLKGEAIIAFEAHGGVGPKLNQLYSLDSTTPLRGSTTEILAGSSLNISDLRDSIGALSRGEITREDYDRIVADALTVSEEPIEEVDQQATLSDRVRLAFNTSFTGEDLLLIRLQGGNVANLGAAFGTDQARLNFQSGEDNDVEIDRAYYRTNWGDNFTFWVGTALPPEDVYETFTPFTESSGTGSLARANRYNPFIYRTTEGGGIAGKYKFNDTFDLTASYFAGNANDPTGGNGIFNGQYSAGAQIGVHPSENLDFGIAYFFNYFPGSVSGASARANLTGSLGSDYSSGVSNAISLLSADGRGGFRGARDPFSGAATTSNNVGIQGNWKISDTLNWAAWVGWANATGESHDSTGVDRRGDNADLWTWSTNFSFIDLFKDGAVFTIAGGQLPSARDVDGTFGRDRSQGWIVEGNYNYPLNDNISITPGVYAIFNPNNSDRSGDNTIVVGVLRTVFKF
jgi:hypothetical protein